MRRLIGIAIFSQQTWYMVAFAMICIQNVFSDRYRSTALFSKYLDILLNVPFLAVHYIICNEYNMRTTFTILSYFSASLARPNWNVTSLD